MKKLLTFVLINLLSFSVSALTFTNSNTSPLITTSLFSSDSKISVQGKKIEATILNNDQITKTVSGNILNTYDFSRRKTIEQTFDKGGIFSVRIDGRLGGSSTYGNKWSVEDKKLCFSYKNTKGCFELYKGDESGYGNIYLVPAVYDLQKGRVASGRVVKTISIAKKAEEKRIADAKKAEKANVKKAEEGIRINLKTLKTLSKQLRNLKLDSLKLKADTLISKVENNKDTSSATLYELRSNLFSLNSNIRKEIRAEKKKRAEAEAKRKAAAEAKRIAEEKRKAAEAKRIAEEKRKAAEAKRIAEEKRKAAEAKRIADYDKGLNAYKNGDYATALSEWTPLAEQGDAAAQTNLGVMYRSGEGVPQDYKTALKWYTLAAEQGLADAQYNLGLMYDFGNDVSQDYKIALKWYRLAAEQGHAAAQTNLGYMYHNGDGVPQDDKTALKWFRLAAEQGHATAQYNLGFMYDNGKGVSQDYKTALKWYTLAAAQGHAAAQTNLGYMYYNGEGVSQNYKTALKWYRLAAEQGHAAAQTNLGYMYHNGDGVPQDDKTALKWFRLAAEQGYADAQYNLGVMYQYGDNVKQDNILAYMWFSISASNVYDDKTDLVTKDMTSDEISSAQKLSQECIAMNYKCVKLEEKRIAEEELKMKLSLIPPKTELQKAQNFLNDIQVFVKNNPGEFDILEVTEFMIQSKPILDGSFKSKYRKNIEAFKRFAETSSNFRVFRKNQLELETQEELKKINRLMISLSTNIKNLESKRKNNSLFSTLIKEQIQSSQLILDNPKTLSEIQNAVKSTSLLIEELSSTKEQIKIANSQITELSAYLQENMTSDLAPEVLSNLKELKNAIREETLKEKIDLHESPSQYIGSIVKLVDAYMLKLLNTTLFE